MQRFAVAGLLVSTIVMIGCEGAKRTASTEGADDVLREVLDAVAAGNAETAYETHFTPEFKKAMSKEEWSVVAEDYRQRLGKVEDVSREKTYDPYVDDDGIVSGSMMYRVTWEKGSGVVSATFLRDVDWKLSSLEYSILDPAPARPRTDGATALP